MHLVDKCRQFHAVGTNILNRGSANCAGNQRKIFKPVQTMLYRPFHQGVPAFACRHPYQGLVGAVFQYLDTTGFNAQYQSVDVTGEHDITALPQRHNRQPLGASQVQCVKQ